MNTRISDVARHGACPTCSAPVVITDVAGAFEMREEYRYAEAAPERGECGNCHEGKSDMDHVCPVCNGTAKQPAKPEAVRLRDELRERASQDDPDSRDPVAFARLAIDYSQNFATAKPDIGATEKEHILGLCSLVERLIAARQPVGQEAEAYLVMAVKDGVAWEHRWYVPRWGDADPTALHGTVYTIRGREHPELGIHHVKAFYAEPPVQAVDLAQLRTQVADVLRGEFDLEVADPEDHRHDDGRGEADRVAGMIVALLDSGKAAQS